MFRHVSQNCLFFSGKKSRINSKKQKNLVDNLVGIAQEWLYRFFLVGRSGLNH